MNVHIETFFDPDTSTLSYVVADLDSKDAVVIDPVLDYNPVGSTVRDTSFQKIATYVKQADLHLHYALETHAHADHLSASQLFRDAFPGIKVAISQRIRGVQQVFKGVYNLAESFVTDGQQFDYLIEDYEALTAGTLTIKSLPTPGHTPACSSYLVEDAVFTGDALFMPDFGTGRCDFPAGDAQVLYQSVQQNLYTLPDATRVFVGHDYQPNGRALAWESTIGEQKAHNVQLSAERSQAEFVAFRQNKDMTLPAPRLIYQSLLVNIEAGHLPQPEDNGQRYLKIPLNVQTQ
ncbi:MAG: MBL fold metallo-hydrolase [Natronospirillum sp.]